MASLPLYDKSGSEIGRCEVDLESLAPKISKQLLHDAVVMYRSNLRQGSAKSKTRAEVHGAKKKMYRQKGTGNARAGHKRSGVRRGGGHIFAKTPRDWYYRMPRKSLQVATRMALASKIHDQNVAVLDAFDAMDVPKTKTIAKVLTALNLQGTLLIAIENHDANIYKSARNIVGVRIMPIAEVNAYEILKPKRVLMTRAALESFLQRK